MTFINSLIILAIALLLIFAEFFLPGGVVGVIGGITFVASIIYFAWYSQSPLYTLIFACFAVIILVLVVRYTLRRIAKGASKSHIYLDSDQEGFCAASFDDNLIGKRATVSSDLKPSGFILVDNQRLQAISKSGYIDAGSIVNIIGGQGAYLFVRVLLEEEKE